MKPFLRRSVPALCALVLLPLSTGCDVLGGSDDVLGNQLRASERRWQEAGPPAAYSLVIERIQPGQTSGTPVRIHVRDGAVISAFYNDTDEPVPAGEWSSYPAVEGLFAIIRDALSRRVSGMGVNYHPDYGFPREIGIDYDYRRSDDDLYIIATDFTLE